MLSEKLKTKEYYKKKLSLFMQNDENITQMLMSFVDVINSFDDVELSFYDAFNNAMQAITAGTSSNINTFIIDCIASLFALNRTMKLTYDADAQAVIDYFANLKQPIKIPDTVRLTSTQLALLIFIKIQSNSYTGGRDSLNDACEALSDAFNIHMSYSTDETVKSDDTTKLNNPGNCIIRMYADIDNVVAYQLFLARLIQIESLGISYTVVYSGLADIGTYVDDSVTDDKPSTVSTVNDVCQIWCDETATYYSDVETLTVDTAVSMIKTSMSREVCARWL